MSDQALPPRFIREYWECLFRPDVMEAIREHARDNQSVRSMIGALAHHHDPGSVLLILGQTVCSLAAANRSLTKSLLDATMRSTEPHMAKFGSLNVLATWATPEDNAEFVALLVRQNTLNELREAAAAVASEFAQDHPLIRRLAAAVAAMDGT